MTSTPPSPRSKPATRRMLTARRDALPAAERAAAAAAIAARVDALFAARTAPATVALYAAKGTEVDTSAIDRAARARGARVAYPRVLPATRALAFHVAAPDELVAGAFALREPLAAAPTVAVTDFDLILLPGIAFDLAGGRLGWGRGYYDATLAPLAGKDRGPLLVGIGYALQVLAEPLPREPHDIPLDLVITDTATHAVAPA